MILREAEPVHREAERSTFTGKGSCERAKEPAVRRRIRPCVPTCDRDLPATALVCIT